VDRDRRIVNGTEGSISVETARRGVGHPRRSGTLAGVKGAIRWHYYNAAAIEGYTVTCSLDGQRWSLTATVVLSDAFKMAQAPLTFAAMHTKKGLDGTCVVKTEWRWRILSLSPIDPTTKQLTARLGPPEGM